MKAYIKQYCKKCKLYHHNGISIGLSGGWCCKFSKNVEKSVGECKLKAGFEEKGQ